MPRPSGRSLPRPASGAFVAIPPLCGVLSGATAALILAGYSVAAGAAALLGAALLVIAEVRGGHMVAGMNDRRVLRFQFGWRMSSSIFDASILAPLAWMERITAPRVTVVALVGLGASYLVAYQLARGQALGYSGWESVPYRIATAVLLVFALLARSLDEAVLEVALWSFAVLAAAGAFTRAWHVKKQDPETVGAEGPA
ncbi:MAG TPA: hypothetical protein VHI54_05075 [Actinomycetota bacterium]|nr:hypothetical protein [Actinomycetota bacterium]